VLPLRQKNKKDIYINKRIKVSHQDADERLCNEFCKCIIDEELVKLSKDMFQEYIPHLWAPGPTDRLRAMETIRSV